MTAFVCVFFFKQKTAYEMRISDWSSDVCSSDLDAEQRGRELAWPGEDLVGGVGRFPVHQLHAANLEQRQHGDRHHDDADAADPLQRSEERRVGKEGVRTCRYAWTAQHKKKRKT